MTYNLKKPMKWEDFSNMPKDLQEEYLQWVISEFSATANNLAEMFQVHPVTVRKYCSQNKLSLGFGRGKRMSPEQRERFNKFINGDKKAADVVQDEPVVEEKVDTVPEVEVAQEMPVEEPVVSRIEQHAAAMVEPPESETQDIPVVLSSFDIDITGGFGQELAMKLYTAASCVIPLGTKVRLRISCVANEGENNCNGAESC